jgi:hypothetical protein
MLATLNPDPSPWGKVWGREEIQAAQDGPLREVAQ